MTVALKSQGALVSQAAGTTTLALPVPALAVSDYVLAVILTLSPSAITPPSGAGWAEVSPSPVFSEGTSPNILYYHVFWKCVSSTASATSETFTVPSAATAGKATVLTGAANAAPTCSGVNNSTAVAYWQSPLMTVGGFFIAHALLFAARTPSGTMTTAGTTVPMGTFTPLTNEQPASASGFSGYRWQTASYSVTNTPNGNVRTGISGGSGTSDVIMMLVPPDTGDTTNPTVAITSPVDGDTLTGTETLTVTLGDNVGVTSAPVTLEDSTSLGSALSGSLSIDTTAIADGAHTITVEAFDAAGNHASDSVSVTVSNPVPHLGIWEDSTETVLDDTSTRWWDEQNEYGFWY